MQQQTTIQYCHVSGSRVVKIVPQVGWGGEGGVLSAFVSAQSLRSIMLWPAASPWRKNLLLRYDMLVCLCVCEREKWQVQKCVCVCEGGRRER